MDEPTGQRITLPSGFVFAAAAAGTHTMQPPHTRCEKRTNRHFGSLATVRQTLTQPQQRHGKIMWKQLKTTQPSHEATDPIPKPPQRACHDTLPFTAI